MIHDFLLHFPWGITIVLAVSLLVATLLVPFMQFWFIRKPMEVKEQGGKKAFSFLDLLQKYYNRLFGCCFAHPKITVAVGLVFVIIGGIISACFLWPTVTSLLWKSPCLRART